ncbi:MAG: TonB-dependent receptor [Sediminibacterium sp.]|nr:TonB-dependent receptor [Sediminibacterium sp.]
MLRICFTFCLIFLFARTFGQPTQVLRGTITDNASNAPVPFVNVLLLNTQPPIGGVTDTLGNFSIPNVPVGRYDLKITCMGYEDAFVREINVISAKQTVLNLSVKENTKTLDEVIIKPNVNKEEPLNAMATVSARMLSVEEAKRYAGGFDDPARLASAFAGVASNSGVNGIIVRGNAPKYLQWKMEGIEIPNPNHFGDLRAFGGGILTGLSSQMLANSDFFTGAFPAEYNNAVSGVFDISMRKGNSEKRESTFQAGIIGIDFAQEGPFRKGGKASYLFNYRNSTLALLGPLLPENADRIKYQDLSFKLNFPTSKAGIFSLWGIGLIDGASAKPKTDSLKWFYQDDKQRDNITQYTGSAGLSHKYFFNSTTYIKTTLAATASSADWKTEILNRQLELKPYSNINYTNWNYVLSSFLNKKINARYSSRTGILITNMNYNVLLNRALTEGDVPTEIVNTQGNSFLISGYSQSSFQLGPRLVLNLGINNQWFTLNNHNTIEPRVGLRQTLGSKQSIGLAYGLHSRIENVNFYYNNSLSTGEKAVNKNLDFTKAHHFVLNYSYKITDLLLLKVEPYYQQLFAVPVMPNSSFSLINLQTDWFFAEKLVNKGEGQNYGIDLTLEKYISKGYYYLITASIFDSKYKGGDGIWYNSRFNRNVVANFLIGKEWQVGKTKQNTISVNTRLSYQGGNRYSPVNESATYAAKTVIYDETMAFSKQSDPVVNVHFTVSYKKNKLHSSREIAFKIINLTGQSDFYGYKYNQQNNTIDKDLTRVILPNLSYKIEF